MSIVKSDTKLNKTYFTMTLPKFETKVLKITIYFGIPCKLQFVKCPKNPHIREDLLLTTRTLPLQF